MDGFFKQADFTSKRPLTLVPRCGECGLFKTCQSPKMPPSGNGRERILIVGEAPGQREDEQGVQFVGKTGQKLRNVIRKVGLDPNRDCVFTNALICRPPGNEIPENKRTSMVDACRPNLLRTIEKYDPDVILLLGKTAIKSLIGHVWKEEVGTVDRWAGFKIPCRKPNVWICPTWHPSFVERADDVVLNRMWERHVSEALSVRGKPWKEVPDYRKRVQCIQDPEQAADQIRDLTKHSQAIAFDFETNMKKPDSSKARIVCCSVCFDGEKTIAFPWHGDAIKATLELLTNEKIAKLGWNMDMEAGWTYARHGKWVKGWKHDGMIVTHVLDNRPDITSLKFQSFVRFGMDSYDSSIKPYLRTKGEGGNAQNRIHEVSLPKLLEYCALDSYLEWKIGKQQMKELYHANK